MAIARVVPIIKVTDMARAIEFYCSTLGFTTDFTYAGSPTGPVYAGLSLEGQCVHLSTFAGDGARGTALYVYVDDVDGLYRALKARGLTTPGLADSPVEEAPVDQTWGMREFYVKDPDGNSLRFGSPIRDARTRRL